MGAMNLTFESVMAGFTMPMNGCTCLRKYKTTVNRTPRHPLLPQKKLKLEQELYELLYIFRNKVICEFILSRIAH